MGARQRSQPPSPEGLFVCLWRESLPHPLLVSRVFRGIKPSPRENTEAPRRIKKEKPPTSCRGIKRIKKQNENQPSFEVRFSLSMVGHRGLKPGPDGYTPCGARARSALSASRFAWLCQVAAEESALARLCKHRLASFDYDASGSNRLGLSARPQRTVKKHPRGVQNNLGTLNPSVALYL